MDTTQTTTLQKLGRTQRDVGAHRRAYLDTYAKRRAGISELAPAPVSSIDITPQIQPPSVPVATQPAVIAVPVVTPQVQQTPVTQQTHFKYTSADQEQLQSQSTSKVEKPRHVAYLDTLVRQHHERVVKAPLQVETVEQPQLTEITQHLIDEASEQRMHANLEALYSTKPLTEHITKNKTSASASHIRTIVASALACGMLSVAIFAFTGRYDAQPVVAQPIGAPVIEVEAPASSVPTGTPKATNTPAYVYSEPTDPVRIIAASIGVNARVSGLGTTSDGLIAVPKSYTSVGWYNKGVTVGQPGPAVFVGHYTGGNGGVFDKLKDIKTGDLITIKNGKNQVFTYKVTVKQEYARDQVPMAEIFKKSSTSRLEIITCSGKWQSSSYDNRLVVTAELVQ